MIVSLSLAPELSELMKKESVLKMINRKDVSHLLEGFSTEKEIEKVDTDILNFMQLTNKTPVQSGDTLQEKT